jgi:PAS domain S-box-containing protein
MEAMAKISSVINSSESAMTACDRALRFLYDEGYISAGILDMPGSSPLRCVVGDANRLAADYLARYHVLSEEDPAGVFPISSEGIFFDVIPVQFAPEASLILHIKASFSQPLFRFLAEQIALALDRSCLQEQARSSRQQAARRIREVSTIYDIGRAIDSMEIDQLLNIITEKASKVMDAQACSLMRLNPDTRALTISASYGLAEAIVDMTQRALGEGIAGIVAQSGEPMLIVDPEKDPLLSGVHLRPEIGSSIVVPMKDEKGSVIGVLSIHRRRPSPKFNDEDLRLFSVFASQAALAITNKQLYDDVHKRWREISTISDLTQAVISHIELNSLLEHVADSIVDVVKFDRCCLYILDRHTRRFIPRIWRGYKEDVITSLPAKFGEGVIGIVAKKQMPVVEDDTANAMQPMKGFARSLGANAFVVIPIISRGQTIGVVVADNRTTDMRIQSDAVELLTTFVNQAGIAIENAQLYEDREQRYQEMNHLATQTDNILRSMAAAVLVVDNDGRVIRWNQAYEDMWDLKSIEPSEHYKSLFLQFHLPEKESENLCKLLGDCLSSGEAHPEYNMELHPEGGNTFFINLLLNPLIDRQGERQGAVMLLEDVTAEMHMEMEMNRMRRLADIGEFAAKMAHEIRNPLSSIKGAAQLMRNDYEDMAPFREFLDIIIDEVNALSKITTDILDFARPMNLDYEQTNLNELAERTLRFMDHQLKESGIETDIQLDDDIPSTYADCKQIEQVMRNIVLNAAQSMPEGGRLTVSTSYDEDQNTVRAHFTDTGYGIQPVHLQNIFQPFFTTKTKGTGLGLAIVRRIVENHGGNVEVSSKPHEGTCFCISLPVLNKDNLQVQRLHLGPELPDS